MMEMMRLIVRVMRRRLKFDGSQLESMRECFEHQIGLIGGLNEFVCGVMDEYLGMRLVIGVWRVIEECESGMVIGSILECMTVKQIWS